MVFYDSAVVVVAEVAVTAVALAVVAAAVAAPEQAVHVEEVVVVDEVAVAAVVVVDGAVGVEFVTDAVESAAVVFAASAVASQRAAIFAGSAVDCSTPSVNTQGCSETLKLISHFYLNHYETLSIWHLNNEIIKTKKLTIKNRKYSTYKYTFLLINKGKTLP